MRGFALVVGLVLVGALAEGGSTSLFPSDPPAHAILVPKPANSWDVSLINGMKFVRPDFPALRTSQDGRIGIDSFPHLSLRVSLISPEQIDSPFVESSAGISICSATTTLSYPPSMIHSSTLASPSVANATLLDVGNSSGYPNPTFRGGRDGYDLQVLAFVVSQNKNGTTELWSTPLHAEVAHPKTKAATLTVHLGTPWLVHTYSVDTFKEAMVTSDGRLLVTRIGGSSLTWPNSSGTTTTGNYDIVYAYTATPGDFTGWQQLYPITHAPFDSRVNGTGNPYGFADQQFRDYENQLIADGVDLPATYPWCDRRGRNLFFETIDATNYFWDSYTGTFNGQKIAPHVRSRYRLTGLSGTTWANPTTANQIFPLEDDRAEATRGYTMMGLWSNGKMVQLDGLLNNTDYGTRIRDDSQRMVELYTNGAANMLVRVGTGRQVDGMPDLASTNANVSDSPENLFNTLPNMTPRTTRDVEWIVNLGKGSEEVVFDDFINRNMFIFAQMTGSATIVKNRAIMTYHDGFRNDGTAPADFDQPVSVDNSATAPPTCWDVPARGDLVGQGRIEPVALGGAHGKGFYLESASRLDFSVAKQPREPVKFPWYVGIFLDPRFTDDGTTREVFSFPDGSGVSLVGTSSLVLRDTSGASAATYALGSLLVPGQFTHLGFVIESGGKKVTTVVNGFRWNEWTAGSGSTGILQLASLPGTVTVGGRSGETGFEGWIDEFKVSSEAPMTELLANHARGTVVQVAGSAITYSGPLLALAKNSPTWSQDQIRTELGETDTTALYACFTQYDQELGASHREVPAGTVSVRSGLIFPEGPLYWNAPRPDSTKNKFCLSCHGAAGATRPSLTTTALQAGTKDEYLDTLRRPLQPPSLMFGEIPAGYFAPNVPSSSASLDSGIWVDAYVLPKK